MSEDKVASAQKTLDFFDGPRQRLDNARHELNTMKNHQPHAKLKDAHETYLAEAQAEHDEALKAYNAHVERQGGIVDLSRRVDLAAQAVLDARGERHTETNILPPGKTAEKEANDE